MFFFPASAAAKSLQSCPTLCNPIDGSPPGSAVSGILQARTLEWVAISFSYSWKWKVKVESLSKCPTLHDLMDCSLPGSSVHGIFQARALELVAIAFLLSILQKHSKSLLFYETLRMRTTWLFTWSHHFMGNRWGNSEKSVRLYFGGHQNHCKWWLQPWNKKTITPWKESYEQPR